MIEVTELRRGVKFELDGDIFETLDYSHNKPGRGNATIRAKVRNLRSGALMDKTFTSGDRVQDISIETSTMQYLYHDGDFYHFMNTETFDQVQLTDKTLGDAVNYLKENQEIILETYEGESLGVELPPNVELKVVEAPMMLAGDTASGGSTKSVILETGLKVNVPLFVNTGDVLRVDTRTGEFRARL